MDGRWPSPVAEVNSDIAECLRIAVVTGMYVYKKRTGITGINGQCMFMPVIQSDGPAFEQLPPGFHLLKAVCGKMCVR